MCGFAGQVEGGDGAGTGCDVIVRMFSQDVFVLELFYGRDHTTTALVGMITLPVQGNGDLNYCCGVCWSSLRSQSTVHELLFQKIYASHTYHL